MQAETNLSSIGLSQTNLGILLKMHSANCRQYCEGCLCELSGRGGFVCTEGFVSRINVGPVHYKQDVNAAQKLKPFKPKTLLYRRSEIFGNSWERNDK